jgi:hypothetical protein
VVVIRVAYPIREERDFHEMVEIPQKTTIPVMMVVNPWKMGIWTAIRDWIVLLVETLLNDSWVLREAGHDEVPIHHAMNRLVNYSSIHVV